MACKRGSLTMRKLGFVLGIFLGETSFSSGFLRYKAFTTVCSLR